MWKRWIILALLTTGVVISYIDRTNFSVVLVMKEFQRDFHITDADRGLLNSAFFWSYTLLQVPAGFIVDRYGIRIPYALGFLLWSGVSAGTAWLGSTSQLIVARVVLGVGESIAGPASIKWISSNYCRRAARVRDWFVFQRHQDWTRDWRSCHDLALASMGLARDVSDTRLRCNGVADSLAAADARGRG